MRATAASGPPDGHPRAADLLEQEPFDLALLDIMLPGADGYELLDYCKALDVPVIFLTALGEVEDRVRGPAPGRGGLPAQALCPLGAAGPGGNGTAPLRERGAAAAAGTGY